MKNLFLYLNIVRWKNLLLLLFSQLLFKYRIFPYFKTTSYFSNFDFFIFATTTLLIAAGGYIINDIYDLKCDSVNKPKTIYIPSLIKLKEIKVVYASVAIVAMGLSVVLCLRTNNAAHIGTFSLVIIILHLYSSHLKRYALIGNIVIGFLISLHLLLLGILDTDMVETNDGIRLLITFSVFAFVINIVREIIKDIEDKKGDVFAGMKTLPIVLGTRKSLNIILFISLCTLCLLLYWGFIVLHSNFSIKTLFFIFIILPFLLFLNKTHKAKNQEDFTFLSALLKVILALGLAFTLLMTI